MIQGINTLPITGGHLYLGLRPDDVVSNFAEIVDVNNGNPTVWQDILWSYLALGDAPAALAALDKDREYPEDEGESRAHTYHWIANLAALGTLDSSIHADDPMGVVFTKDGARTYVASNITQEPLKVTFSDGTVLDVAAGKTATSGAQTWSGGGAPSGTELPGDPNDPPVPTTTPFYLSKGGSFLAAPGPDPTATLGARTGADAVGDPATGLTFTAKNLNGSFGAVKVDLWNVLGNTPSTIDLATSVVRLPFAGLTLTGGGSEPEPSGLPGSPAEVKLTPVSGSAMVVVWTAPTVTGTATVTDYLLQYRATNATEWVPVYDAVTSTPGARIQGLNPGTEYQVRVQSVSAAGLGEFSQPVAASTFPALSAPPRCRSKGPG